MDLHQVAEIFNGRAVRYVNDEWHRCYAEQLVDLTPLREGDRVLDAATGTGFAARAIARRVGQSGCVVGVDISARMLEQARIVMDAASLTNADPASAGAEAIFATGFDEDRAAMRRFVHRAPREHLAAHRTISKPAV